MLIVCSSTMMIFVAVSTPERSPINDRSRCKAVVAMPGQTASFERLPPGKLRPVPSSCLNETGVEDRTQFCNPLAADDPSHESLATRVKESTAGIRRGMFLFLVQGTGSPSDFWKDVAARTDAAFLWLSWETAVPTENQTGQFDDYLFFPNSSFNRGRNRLLRRGLELEIEQGWLFEYYVFMDEDQEFMEFKNQEDMELADRLFTGTNRSPATIAMLVHLLIKYRPARAGIRNDRSHTRKSSEHKRHPCMTSIDLDGNVEAIHRSALEVMMPYVSKYDEVVVWVGNSMMNVRADVLLGSFSVKFNQLITYPYIGNQKHTEYPKLKFEQYRHKLYCFISSCLSSDAERAFFLYSKEETPRMFSRIDVLDDRTAAPCYRMMPDVDYSTLLNKHMSKTNFFLR